MAFEPLVVPSRLNRPDQFAEEAELCLNGVADFIEKYNELSSVLNGAITSTSTTSLTIGTGTKSPVVQPGLNLVPGYPIRLAYRVDPTKYMDGVVLTYDSVTGALSSDISSPTGSGTYADWQVMVLAAPEPSPVAGPTHAASSKTTPVDADEIPLIDSAASFSLKRLTWANLKATLKTYFDPLYLFIVRGHISGLTMSTPGASASISVAPGEAADSTNSIIIRLVSALTKTTAAWAVGNNQGGLDTGVIANNTGYHKFLIRRPDTGVVDGLLSLSSTAPTLPANYTQFRRIGWGMTNGSGQWRSFFQFGDFFGWVSPTLDVSIASSGTSAVLNTLPVPSGVQVLVNVNVTTGNSSNLIYLSSPDSADLPPSSSVAPLTQVSSNVGTVANLKTNTSAQIRSRSSINTLLNITTTSWIDNRGKEA